MPENRIDSVTVANQEENARVASIATASPTGTPLLPPKMALWGAVVVAVAAALPFVPGIPPVVLAVCGIVVTVGTVLGIVSPGVRKP